MRRGLAVCFLLIALCGCTAGRYEPEDIGIKWQIPQRLEDYRELKRENYEIFREIDLDTLADILNERKTCNLLLSYPDCENCQSAIDDIASYARKNNEAVYYLDLLACLADKESYERALSLLEPVLRTNAEGEKRIYTPELIEIRDGAFGRYFIGVGKEELKEMFGDR